MAAKEPVLSRRLALERRERVPDGAGGYIESWVLLGKLWAEMSPSASAERDRDTLTAATVPWRIIVRAAPVGRSSRPRPDQRFREDDRVYRILSVAEHDRMGRFLACRALEEEVSA